MTPAEAVARCRRGHPMTEENTYVSPTGSRRCRACRKITGRRWEAKRRRKTARPRGMGSDNYVLDDLDLALLEALPDEGAKVGKYLPDSRTSGQLYKELNDQVLTAHIIGRRLGMLHEAGYVVPSTSRAAKASKGWQRTAKGKAEV